MPGALTPSLEGWAQLKTAPSLSPDMGASHVVPPTGHQISSMISKDSETVKRIKFYFKDLDS